MGKKNMKGHRLDVSLSKTGSYLSNAQLISHFFPERETNRIQEVANRLGANWNYQHPSEIMAEIASLSPLFAGLTYERLEGYKSLQWPMRPDGTDEPPLFTEKFNFPDGKARFYPVGWLEPHEQVDEEFDLLLNNGRLLEHFHEGNMTYKANGIKSKTPDVWIEVSPQLAAERKIEDGRWVELTSRRAIAVF
jgi:formate dehydrogenase major subunit